MSVHSARGREAVERAIAEIRPPPNAPPGAIIYTQIADDMRDLFGGNVVPAAQHAPAPLYGVYQNALRAIVAAYTYWKTHRYATRGLFEESVRFAVRTRRIINGEVFDTRIAEAMRQDRARAPIRG